MNTESRKLRGRVAVLTRHRDGDDPELTEARRDLAAAALAEHVRKVVSSAPPLTAEQRDRIAALLRPNLGRVAKAG